jgi:alkanesulfonate monooxygenase SsuD/methylene tetrahydromethanopterin reductase-like flavin-dependent oxidoreductase (luciferase family)
VTPAPALGFGLPGGLDIEATAVLRLARRAGEAGLGPVLFTEVSGFDATALSAALAAAQPTTSTGTGIVPLGSRTVAATAMAARTAAELSAAPYLLGVGVSTRQIVEGWHEAAYDPTVATTGDRLEALRTLLAGGRRGSFALPSAGEADVRVLLGAMGPRMIALARKRADGVIVNHTPPSHLPDPVEGSLLVAYCWVIACDDGARRIRREVTSYAMADPYARHFTLLGFGDAVARVRSLHAEGRLREAPATLPDALLDALYVAPAGLPARLAAFRDAGALPVIMPVTGDDPEAEIDALLDREPWAG